MALRRVLVANRGEIAVRIVRACRALGIETVVATSAIDRDSLAAKLADRSVCIGPSPSNESYLRVDLLVQAAIGTGCDAVHPGYGFLSENSAFSEACAQNGLVFVGPPPAAVHAVGDKRRARESARAAGVPVVAGLDDIRTTDDVLAFGRKNGYPILIKAASGGGGRGMFVARTEADVRANIDRASAEALAAFGDGSLYVERFIERARHVEVQVFGDGKGRVVHFGDRDCSVQRRHQKLVEEAPAPGIPDGVRSDIHASAVRFAEHIGYVNAGTVELVYDADTTHFYFIEMNARIQVEHPVSEAVSGADLVQTQLLVAGGDGIGRAATHVGRSYGHAIEVRVNAESAKDGFLPRPGRITAWRMPEGEGIRVDTHCYAGYLVPPFYDSLLAKLIVHAPTRAQAIAQSRSAVRSFHVEGVPTTLDVHAAILDDSDFARGGVTTQWLERELLPRYFH
jgi:acetyl-CoA carboxylase biotin carboxylase subunit